jgi:hypothetical protein
MKRLVIISLLALAACAGGNEEKKQEENALPASLVNNPRTADGMDATAAGVKPEMVFKDTLHDFGTMHEGEVVEYDFNFTNTGKGPLIITSAMGSCGCTVPEFTRDPIPPGQSGVMKVTFNSAGKSGHQEKSVSIHTNTIRSVHMLYIKSEVKK